MLWLIPTALACPLNLPEGERAAFHAALEMVIPEDSTLPADARYRGWLRTGKPDTLRDAASGYAEAAGQGSPEERARAALMEAAALAELGEPGRSWRGVARSLRDTPFGAVATYEAARQRGGCGGIAGYMRLSFPPEHPLAPYELLGEAMTLNGVGEQAWETALAGRAVAEAQGQAAAAVWLDDLAAENFTDHNPPQALPVFLTARCGGDAACAAEQTERVRAAAHPNSRWQVTGP